MQIPWSDDILLFTQRLPPASTLFPYTTLFRSAGRRGRGGARRALGRLELDAARLGRRGQDRKSTRLNSSHGYISYAVFCLKKKNPGPQRHQQIPSRNILQDNMGVNDHQVEILL